MDMNKKEKICKIEGCNCKVKSNELCTTHYNQYYRSGDVAGVYKIMLGDKIYIGQSYLGVNSRVATEKSGLRKDNPQSVSSELRKYFNELCMQESELTRDEVLEKYFEYEILEESARWYRLDENGEKIEYVDSKEQREKTFKVNTSENPEVKEWNNKAKIYWEMRENHWIRHYKNIDKENCTQNCLNIKCR